MLFKDTYESTYSLRFSYKYDINNNIAEYIEYDVNGEICYSEFYEYNAKGQLEAAFDSENNIINYIYDNLGNLEELKMEINNDIHTVNYFYNKSLDFSNDLYDTESSGYDKTEYITQDGETISVEYNYEMSALYRLDYINLITSNFNLRKEFVFDGNTSRISKISYDFNDNSTINDYEYSYEYDSIGNITYEYYYELEILMSFNHYEYDEMEQLIIEDVYDNNEICTNVQDTCYTKMFYYDLRGNITDIRTFVFEERDYIDIVLPNAYHNNNGTSYASMNYNGSNGYNSVYEIPVGGTTNLTFTYYEMFTFPPISISRMTTVCASGQVNTANTGYYLYECNAYDRLGIYDLDFGIVIKVGNPTQVENTPVEHIHYNYDDQWLDQMISYGIIDYINGVPQIENIIQEYIYDSQGNPIKITNFIYNETLYDYADLEYDGRQLTKITVKDDSIVGKNLLDESNFNSASSSLGTINNINVLPNTTYTLSIPNLINPLLYIEGEIWYIEDEDASNVCDFLGEIWACTFTTSSSETSISISIYDSSIGAFLSYYGFVNYFQLELGPDSTTIIPYSNVLVTLSYAYNDQGLRTSKVIDTGTTIETIKYKLFGDRIIYETNGTYSIWYTYDFDGKVISYNFDSDGDGPGSGIEFFYLRNQFGDIIKIVDINGNILVEYKYDSWGNVIETLKNENFPQESDTAHTFNRYFYRGYRYD